MNIPSITTRWSACSIALSCSLALAVQAVFVTAAAAQCNLDWKPGAAAPGPAGTVHKMVRLANGDLVAVGQFAVADRAIVNNAARFDGVTWQPMNGGLQGWAMSAAVMPNGDLIVGGYITSAGGVSVNNIARWDGTSWSAMGVGLNGNVSALAVLPNGDVVAAGGFQVGGPPGLAGVARWNGSSWSAMGSTGHSLVQALTVAANGTIFAAGDAWVGVPDIVSWNGTAWVGLPGVPTSSLSSVEDCLAMSNGDLLIRAGLIEGSQRELATWNGTQFQLLPNPAINVSAFAEASNGDVIAAGYSSSTQSSRVLRHNGTSWVALGADDLEHVRSLLVDSGGTVFAGGSESESSSLASVARYQAGAWSSVGAAKPADVHVVQGLPNGDLIVGGEFDVIDGVAASNIARYDGSTYSPLGQGLDGLVTSLAVRADGSLLVAGEFTLAGGAPAQRIASWNGSNWSTLGLGLEAPIKQVVETGSGEIFAVTESSDRYRVFDGVSWNTVTGPIGVPYDALALPDGSVAVIGAFVQLGDPSPIRGAYRYSGGSLAVIPGSMGGAATSAVVAPNGDLVFSSLVAGVPGIYLAAAQQPQLLIPLPFSTFPSVMEFMPNGDLLAGGAGAGSSGGNVWRFNGVAWQLVDGGVGHGAVRDLALQRDGTLVICGDFLSVGGHVSAGLARATTNCPASVVTFGAGCIGSAGPMQLVADSHPWLGSEFSATASGFTAQSLGLNVIGLPVTPSALPLSPPGCSLQVTPLQTRLMVPNAGSSEASVLIPNDPNLVGQVLRTQVVGLELGAGSALLRLTSTNALELIIGSF